jgi:methyl-accepting chemotaxis protein
MRIDRRLATALAIGLVPVAIGALMIVGDMSAIERARTEADGIGYAGLVLPELTSLARDNAAPAANPALAAAAKANDGKLGTGAISEAYANLKADVANGAFPAAARQAAATLIARIHEAAGVTTDTDGNARLSAEVPQAANAAPLSPALLDASRYAPVVVPAAVSRLTEVLAEFRAAIATDDRPQSASLAAYTAAATTFADLVEAGIAALAKPELRETFNWAGLDAAHGAYQDAALDLGQNANMVLLQQLQARIADAGFRIWLASAIALLGLAIGIGYFLNRLAAGRRNQLVVAMQQLAGGNLDADIPYADGRGELGAMARGIAQLRDALRQSTSSEGAQAELDERHRAHMLMMQDLQRSFGDVVDAALEGDFTRRIDATFADQELTRLAGSVNTLVGRIDQIIGETGQALSALADTDLTHRMDTSYGGALGQLGHDTNQVAERLGEVVNALKQSAEGLKTATGEILSGANDLSERTTRQAATIEETSAAMTQLAGTVRANAEKAEDARHVAAEVSRTAEEGGVVMQQANAAMERITASSSKISNIIGLIDDIAFQTNLLALNASVEAARAGEAGKGFAVVAVEVRRLAQSAAQASSEVKALIEASGGEVQGGTRLVAEAAGKLAKMLGSAQRSSALMAEIASESHHQASSIDEVNAAVRQLDEMTQHNAALVEEINAAIEQTEAQAGQVDGIAAIFTVDAPAKARQRSRAA